MNKQINKQPNADTREFSPFFLPPYSPLSLSVINEQVESSSASECYHMAVTICCL